MSVSGVDDSSDPGSGVDFKSRNEDRISVSEVPMLTPAELITLPKGQAFALLEGGQLWKIRMPLPADGYGYAGNTDRDGQRDGTHLHHQRSLVSGPGTLVGALWRMWPGPGAEPEDADG